MSWQIIQQRWNECVVQAREVWDRLTAADCVAIAGVRDRLVTHLLAAYAVSLDEAHRQVEAFASNIRLGVPVRPASPATRRSGRPIGYMGTRYPHSLRFDGPEYAAQIRAIATAGQGRPRPAELALAPVEPTCPAGTLEPALGADRSERTETQAGDGCASDLTLDSAA